jgi:transcriptional regulator with XRE-family HTH domain
MSDLKEFGKALRAIRVSRNITQEQAVERSETYSEGSGLRKIERGEQCPRRKTIIDLLTLGLDEKDAATINELLILAGYAVLSDAECTRLGLEQTPAPASPVRAVSRRDTAAYPGRRAASNLMIVVSVILAAALCWPQDWFHRVAALLYAGLFVTSVLLESAHGFQGEATTLRTAVVAGSITLAAALFGGWTNTATAVLQDPPEALGVALLIFAGTAVLQWFLVRPALTEDAVAHTRFQPHTPQGAHLKNTLYFLFTAVGLWLVPEHCLRTAAAIAKPRKPSLSSTGLTDGACPAPLWLWVILLALLAISVPMASRLLDNLRPSPNKNLYVSLFYTRAFLYFSFAAVCILSYSRSYSELISKLVMNSSP